MWDQYPGKYSSSLSEELDTTTTEEGDGGTGHTARTVGRTWATLQERKDSKNQPYERAGHPGDREAGVIEAKRREKVPISPHHRTRNHQINMNLNITA